MDPFARRGLRAGLAVIGLLAAASTVAQETRSRDRYFGVGLGHISPDGGARDAEDGFGAQLLFGWELSRFFNAELATNNVCTFIRSHASSPAAA